MKRLRPLSWVYIAALLGPSATIAACGVTSVETTEPPPLEQQVASNDGGVVKEAAASDAWTPTTPSLTCPNKDGICNNEGASCTAENGSPGKCTQISGCLCKP